MTNARESGEMAVGKQLSSEGFPNCLGFTLLATSYFEEARSRLSGGEL